MKELRARLSSYVHEVRAGETLLVTDRNQSVARLGPVEQASLAAEPEPAARLAAIDRIVVVSADGRVRANAHALGFAVAPD